MTLRPVARNEAGRRQRPPGEASLLVRCVEQYDTQNIDISSYEVLGTYEKQVMVGLSGELSCTARAKIVKLHLACDALAE